MRKSLIVVLLTCLACGPSLRGSMLVPKVPAVVPAGRSVQMDHREVHLDRFVDARADKTLVIHGSGKTQSEGEVGQAVESALRSGLVNAGFGFNDFAPLVISGEVREWEAEVESGLPSEVSASAKVFIEVRDPAEQKIYSGEYFGSAGRKHPSLGKEDVSDALATAMQQALLQLMSDADLLDVLRSF